MNKQTAEPEQDEVAANVGKTRDPEKVKMDGEVDSDEICQCDGSPPNPYSS